MNDDESDNQAELEAALKRYRPAGPPPGLRARALSTPPTAGRGARHTFGHSAVAYLSIAALIAMAVATHWATTLTDARLAADLAMPPAIQQAAIEELTETLGGDLVARLNATLLVVRVSQGSPNPEVPIVAAEGEAR